MTVPLIYHSVPPTADKVTLNDPNPYNNSVSGAVRQDAEHIFHCDVTGTRPEVQIIWMKNSEPQSGETKTEINGDLINTLGNLRVTPTRTDHRSVLQCEADINISGVPTVSKQLTLDVYGKIYLFSMM